ncbi:restriction endonuclease subunit S [Trichocoleus desertorum AS-A10]|uniref:restriction endonuclease subunit S n=1 Tax=Trichocoleus desertorum TaxID=1481672 RepID=UPI00329730D5
MSIKSRTLPAGWKWSKLGEVLHSIEAGKSPKAQERPADAGEWGVLKVSSVTWGEFRCQENKALFPEFKADGIPTVRTSDLLLSRANTVELVGAVAIAREDYPNLILSDKTLRLNPNLNLANPLYLLHALRTQEARTHLESHATGTSGSMRNVSQESIRNTPILIPPLEEQNRIAAILDRADAIRRKRQEAIALTQELLRSAFLEMFGDPIINPKSWNLMPISDVATKARYAIVDGPFGASLKQEEYVEEGIPVIRINNIKPLTFHNKDFKFITQQKFNELKRSAVRKNDLLMARVGHTVGKACLFDQDYPALLSTTGVAKITCDSSTICPEFLIHQLNLPQYQKYLAMHVGGAGQPYLNLTKIKALQIIAAGA